ncbi:MAG: hypothetical protein ABI423_02770 [Burkholderiales bacterium]
MINAKLDIGFFDAREARAEVPVQVTLDARGLTLLMPDESGEPVLMHGERRGQGHYIVSAQTAGMEASLHRFADSTILEGFWRNGRDRGFWRLHLPLDTVLPRESRVVKLAAGARKRRAVGTRNTRKRVRRAA